MNYCPKCNIGLDYIQAKEHICNNCSHEWEVYHVLPVDDLKPHT